MKANKNFILQSSLSIVQAGFAKLKLNTMKNINPKYSFSFLVSLLQLLTRRQLYKNFWELKIYKTEGRIFKMLRIVFSEFQQNSIKKCLNKSTITLSTDSINLKIKSEKKICKNRCFLGH